MRLPNLLAPERTVRRFTVGARSLSHDRKALAVLVALALVLVFYSGTAWTSATTFPVQVDVGGRDYFNLLTDAFLHGQADLLVEPSPQLRALDDPYDATTNISANRLHDLSLYEDRYYLYWPPTPVLTLFGPVRVALLGGDLPERAAIVIYVFVGLLFALALLRYLVRRNLPDTPDWMLALAGLAIATANVAPYLLRRPTVYEVAISAGYCFVMAAAYFLLRGTLEEPRRWRRLLAGSVCLGLAIGARATLVVAGAFTVAALMYLLRRGQLPTWALRRRAALVLFGPVALAIVLMLAYNALRFDDFTEFGLVYQLNDLDPYPPGLAHVVPSLYFYLLAPTDIDLNFPYFHHPFPAEFPGPVPAGFNRETISGLLPNAPIVLLALVALPLMVRSSLPQRRELGGVMLVATGVGALMVLVVVVPIYAATMRYSMDFTTLFLVPGLLGWMLLAQAVRNRHLGRLIAVGGAGLILYSAALGLALSFTGEKDGLRVGHPGFYERLEQAASVLPVAATAVAGEPVITEVTSPAGFVKDAGWWDVSAGDLFVLHVGYEEPARLKIVSPDRRDVLLQAVTRAPPRGADGVAIKNRERPEISTLPVTNADGEARLALERGVNYIELRPVDPPAPPKGESPLTTPVVTLENVRLAER
ncbi:MAG: hypothetical protein H0U25_12385 [Thermoleophilaceae bacterium]|nr:hypothetical protein [Thermoleophilaceae bacterium]